MGVKSEQFLLKIDKNIGLYYESIKSLLLDDIKISIDNIKKMLLKHGYHDPIISKHIINNKKILHVKAGSKKHIKNIKIKRADKYSVKKEDNLKNLIMQKLSKYQEKISKNERPCANIIYSLNQNKKSIRCPHEPNQIVYLPNTKLLIAKIVDNYLQNNGYLDGKKVRINELIEENTVNYEVNIFLGDQYFINSVKVFEKDGKSASDVEDIFRYRVSKIYSYKKIENSLSTAKNYLFSQGFIDANVSIESIKKDCCSNFVDVEILVHKNKKYFIKSINISGLNQVESSLVLGELESFKNAEFNIVNIEKKINRFKNETKLFSAIDYDFDKNLSELNFAFKERKSNRIKLLFGLSLDDGLKLQNDFSKFNLFQKNFISQTSLILNFRNFNIAQIEGKFLQNFTYKESFFKTPALNPKINFVLNRYAQENYWLNTGEVSFVPAIIISNHLSIEPELAYDFHNASCEYSSHNKKKSCYLNRSERQGYFENGKFYYMTLGTSLINELANREILRGLTLKNKIYANYSFGHAYVSFKKSIGFLKVGDSFSIKFSFLEHYIISNRLLLDYYFTSLNNLMPLKEKLFLGGRNLVKGFAKDFLPANDNKNNPQASNGRIILANEFVFPSINNYYFSLIGDIGYLFKSISNFNYNNIAASFGFGTHFMLFFGLLDAYLSFGVLRAGHKIRSWQDFLPKFYIEFSNK